MWSLTLPPIICFKKLGFYPRVYGGYIGIGMLIHHFSAIKLRWDTSAYPHSYLRCLSLMNKKI